MFHIKITQSGWEGFSGELCNTAFVDGVSVDALPQSVSDRIAAVVSVEVLDAEGNAIGQGGIAARLVNYRQVEAEPKAATPTMTAEEKEAELRRAAEEAGVDGHAVIYTEEQLIAIGSAEGIKGLRVIAKDWKVVGREIPKLIALILAAQAQKIVRTEDKARKEREAAEAALAEAERIRLEQEAKIAGEAKLFVENEHTKRTTAEAVAGALASIAPAEPIDQSQSETPPADAEGEQGEGGDQSKDA